MTEKEYDEMVEEAHGESTQLAQLLIEAEIFPVTDADWLLGIPFHDLVYLGKVTARIML